MLNIPSQYMHYRLVLLCGLLCYCVRDRNHCCVLCDARNSRLAIHLVYRAPAGEAVSFSKLILNLVYLLLRYLIFYLSCFSLYSLTFVRDLCKRATTASMENHKYAAITVITLMPSLSIPPEITQ